MHFFSGVADDLLRLAEDEARMLGRGSVQPEHLLLAFCRRGRGRDLLALQSVRPTALHAAIVRNQGLGDELLLGRIPRSAVSRTVLERAVVIGGERGTGRPGDVEVLLALVEDDRAARVLADAGVEGLAELIDQEHAERRPPLEEPAIRSALLSAALDEGARPLRVPVPAFERFSTEARRAVGAAAETAARLEHREVEPLHLLLGCLQVPDCVGGQALSEPWRDDTLGVRGGAMDQARRHGPHPSQQATGRFSDAARRIVAEEALAIAYRHGHPLITTGHLALAVLDDRDLIRQMTGRHTQRLARSLTLGLPGVEHTTEPDHELDWIAFDQLMRSMIFNVRRILPPGWTIHGSARSDVHLGVPGSRSESDFQIRPGWITSQPGPGSERLQRVTLWMLEQLQAAVSTATGEPWPLGDDGEPSRPFARITPQRFNSTLGLGYGDPDAPALRVTPHDELVHMLVLQA